MLALLLAAIMAGALSGCATMGDLGPAICHASDGSMVPLSDPKCPEEIRRAMNKDSGPPVSVDQSINNDEYNMENGLAPGEPGAR